LECGLIRQVDPPLAPYEESEDPEYLTEEPGIRQTFRGILEQIERLRSPPGRLLDIGCGPGLLLEEAASRGWTPEGIEPSDWGVSEARSRGLDVRAGTIEDAQLRPGSFDAAVAADVIEHVADPLAFVRALHHVLKPKGVVFIATPNVQSLMARVLRRRWWSVIPNHLWYFSPDTLSSLLRKARLEPVEHTTHPKTFSIDYYAGRLGGYNTLVGRAARRVGGVFGGRHRLVTPNFRDRIAMLAVRSEES
jgi:SAM-dependent methyltransferase